MVDFDEFMDIHDLNHLREIWDFPVESFHQGIRLGIQGISGGVSIQNELREFFRFGGPLRSFLGRSLFNTIGLSPLPEFVSISP